MFLFREWRVDSLCFYVVVSYWMFWGICYGWVIEYFEVFVMGEVLRKILKEFG